MTPVWRATRFRRRAGYLFRARYSGEKTRPDQQKSGKLLAHSAVFRTTNAGRDSIVCWFILRHARNPTDSLSR